MLKLNRTTEYGLIILRHMHVQRGLKRSNTTAREVADALGLPFEITAKTLQRLKDAKLIDSVQGARGGYSAAQLNNSYSLLDFLNQMEGAQRVVECAEGVPSVSSSNTSKSCEYQGKCGLKGVMTNLNHRVQGFLKSVALAELVAEKAPETTAVGASDAVAGVSEIFKQLNEKKEVRIFQ